MTRPFRAFIVLARSIPSPPAAALAWLGRVGASRWLVVHHELVLETADELALARGRTPRGASRAAFEDRLIALAATPGSSDSPERKTLHLRVAR